MVRVKLGPVPEAVKRPVPKDPGKVSFGKRSLGEAAADTLAEIAGSWAFIISLLVIMGIWVAMNLYYLTGASQFDPYPFILLNFVLSTLAAFQGPIILMSQNRADKRDHSKSERDYYVNRKSEREIENMQQDLDEIKAMIRQLHYTTVLKKSEKQ